MTDRMMFVEADDTFQNSYRSMLHDCSFVRKRERNELCLSPCRIGCLSGDTFVAPDSTFKLHSEIERTRYLSDAFITARLNFGLAVLSTRSTGRWGFNLLRGHVPFLFFPFGALKVASETQ